MYDQPRCLWDLTSAHSPVFSCGPELLHLDFLNHLGGVKSFFLCLLSRPRRAHVAGVIRQRRTLFGPGALPLKDPVKDYTRYTGAHKGLLGKCPATGVSRSTRIRRYDEALFELHGAQHTEQRSMGRPERRGCVGSAAPISPSIICPHVCRTRPGLLGLSPT
ncbi:unnamed protein product [Pylaiella littoralis]